MGNARGHLVRAPRPDPYRPLCYAIAILVLCSRWLSFPRLAGGRTSGTKESPKLPNRAPDIDGPYLVSRNPDGDSASHRPDFEAGRSPKALYLCGFGRGGNGRSIYGDLAQVVGPILLH